MLSTIWWMNNHCIHNNNPSTPIPVDSQFISSWLKSLISTQNSGEWKHHSYVYSSSIDFCYFCWPQNRVFLSQNEIGTLPAAKRFKLNRLKEFGPLSSEYRLVSSNYSNNCRWHVPSSTTKRRSGLPVVFPADAVNFDMSQSHTDPIGDWGGISDRWSLQIIFISIFKSTKKAIKESNYSITYGGI